MKQINKLLFQVCLLVIAGIFSAVNSNAQAPDTPGGLVIQARDVNRAVVRWNLSATATSYKVLISEDSVTFTEAATAGAEEVFVHLQDLTPATIYNIHVVASNDQGDSEPAAVKLNTVTPALSVHIPLDTLQGDTAVYEAISLKTSNFTGQLNELSAETSGIGVPATKFVQDELEGINSWANISNFIIGTDINDNLMSRTFSIWLKNESPSLYTVPISIEKRTGMSIAFKNDSIFAFLKQRPQYPSGVDWIADKVGVPFTSSDWTFVTVVYDDPLTHLYLNGILAGTSPGGEWIFPKAWQVGTGDKSAEIGALKDPCAGLVQYLGDTWDPGARNFFNGSLADIKMFNYAATAEDVFKAYKEVVAPPTPTGVVVQGRDTDRAIIRWNLVDGATGYKVYTATDSLNYTLAAEVGEVNFAPIGNLSQGTTYQVRVVSINAQEESLPAEIELITINPALVVHIPLDQLREDSIYEALSDKTTPVVGQLDILSAENSGLGIPATKFVQDELGGISSYANISAFVIGTDINDNLMSRTFSLWLKNESPSLYTVPISIEKRTGMTVAFKDDSIYAFIKHRPQYPAGVDWVADKVAAPFSSSDWTLVTVVYNDPVTHLYLNGHLVATSPGGEWIFPRAWQVGTGDKNAEIGALRDPCAGLVQYLGDGWDPGVRHYFNGSIADIRMYNYTLSDADILNEYKKLAAFPDGFMIQANSDNGILLKWNALEVDNGFKVEYSADGTTFTEAGNAPADAVVYPVTGLNANTEYHFKLTPLTAGLVGAAMVSETTLDPAMVAQFNFSELSGDTGIIENISGQVEKFIGQFSVETVSEQFALNSTNYRLDVNALKVTQDELGGINSYARLYKSLLALTPAWLERSMSFWIQNEAPELWSVPFSVEKRTGFGIAFKNDSIWVFTKHRPRFPAGTDWIADGVGYPYGTADWTHVAYVYQDPHTSLYLNGVKVATSEGGTWAFPTNIAIEAGGDKSASIGSLLDPDAAMVQYLGDSWDPGARRFFNGKMADVRFFNYSLGDQDVNDIMMESLTDLTSRPDAEATRYSVYPNPANDILFIQTKGREVGVTIYSSSGSVILSRNLNGNQQINISELNSGMYILQISEGNTSEFRKISVIR